MFGLFERLLKPTEMPEHPEPPPGLVGFYWHFARQAKGLLIGLFAAGFMVALLDSMIPVFIGRVVTLITSVKPQQLIDDHWHVLAGMAVVLLVLRPLALTAQNIMANQAIAANVSNMIRWQSHWHVVRQSWAFFQNDFAGRIANRVMQTGPAIRETLVALLTAVWYILVYGTSAVILLAAADRWLALPILIWFAAYLVMLRIFVPRMRDRSKDMSEVRSMLTGRVVDSYTNILTVKLFARAREEDAYVREAVDEHTGMFHASLRLNTLFGLTLSSLNAMMVTGTAALAIYLWVIGKVEVGTVAMALPLTWQIVNISGWVAWQVTNIFENIGVVQEGMMTIAKPIGSPTRRRRPSSRSRAARSSFEDVRFGYGRETTETGSPCCRRLHADREAGREDRAGRPLRRRQVDGGQPAAALLRRRGRPHPDRRPGHRQRHAGVAARADLGGDAGHLAAAPLDPREHPLRPAQRQRRRGRDARPSSRMPRSSSRRWRTGRAGAATRRRSASAA